VTEFHDYHGPMIHIAPTEEEQVGFTIDDVCLYRNLSISQEKITDLLIQSLYLIQDHHRHHHHHPYEQHVSLLVRFWLSGARSQFGPSWRCGGASRRRTSQWSPYA
jgi:hypothetical protein